MSFHYRMEGHIKELLVGDPKLISNPFVHDYCFLKSFCKLKLPYNAIIVDVL